MSRLFPSLSLPLLLVGCQIAPVRTCETPAPLSLGERLATIENHRLISAQHSHVGIGGRDKAAGSTNSPNANSYGTDFQPMRKALGPPQKTRMWHRRPAGVITGETPVPQLDAPDSRGSALLSWDSGALRRDADPWTLSSFDETALFEQPDGQDQTNVAFWSEKEDKYLRRPPLASFWDTVKRDLKYMPEDIWRDTKRVYTKPLNLVILGTAFGGSLALQEAGPDDSVESHFRRERPFGRHEIHRHFSSGWRDGFGAAGNPATHFALAGLWYLAGQQTMDDKTYEVGKTLFSALSINGITVLLGQAASADRSPNGETGTFPSGHTSSTFVVASVLDEAYGPAVGIPMYMLGGLVAHERIESGEHYFSDVVMGAVLGTVIGHSVAQGRDPEFFGWKIVPYTSSQGGTGIAFVKNLP